MLRRAITAFKPGPYLVAIACMCLGVLAAWGLVDALMSPDDTLVIEVVPRDAGGHLRVQVDGAVAAPGVYLLPAGSARSDAIAAAGGYLPEVGESTTADQPLADGDVVLVAGAQETANGPAGPVNINTASASELEALPGIGPAIAGRIVAYREQHGPFASAADLAAVSGISERMAAELQPLVTTGAP